MRNNPILNVPLTQVMRSEIALPMQHVFHIYTVGSFLQAWNNPRKQRGLEQLFDTPQQARHAASVCAAWAGVGSSFILVPNCAPGWWRADRAAAPDA